MIRPGVVLVALGLVIMSISAMAASFSVMPTVLQSFVLLADIDASELPGEGPESCGDRERIDPLEEFATPIDAATAEKIDAHRCASDHRPGPPDVEFESRDEVPQVDDGSSSDDAVDAPPSPAGGIGEDDGDGQGDQTPESAVAGGLDS